MFWKLCDECDCFRIDCVCMGNIPQQRRREAGRSAFYKFNKIFKKSHWKVKYTNTMFCWWDRSKEILAVVSFSLAFFSVVHLLRPRLLHFLQSIVRFAGYYGWTKKINFILLICQQKKKLHKTRKKNAENNSANENKRKDPKKCIKSRQKIVQKKRNNLLKSVREWIEAMGHSLCKYLCMPLGVWISFGAGLYSCCIYFFFWYLLCRLCKLFYLV